MATAALEQAYRVIADAVEQENEAGGVARGIVMEIGWVVGVDLATNIVDDEIWSEGNMRRVLDAVRGMAADTAVMRRSRRPMIDGGSS